MKNIVLIGAGGTGMSGVAGLLHDLGFENLVCVDSVQSQLTDRLVEKGLNVIIGHGKYEIMETDAVIYSEACVDSQEVQKAKSFPHNGKKIRFVMNYFEFLGEISKYFKTVGFAGTNGKSSTSSLGIFTASRLLPDFGLGILGALVPDFGNNSYLTNREKTADLQNIFQSIFSQKGMFNYDLVKKYYFLLEACEYKRHFLHLDLDYVIITNMNLDHTDYFADEKDYISAFVEMVNGVKKSVIVNNLDVNGSFAAALDDDLGTLGCGSINSEKFIFVEEEKFDFKYIFGEHWNWNGSFVVTLIELLSRGNVAKDEINQQILQFGGLWRRMELLGENKNGAKIFSDYGHVAESIKLGYLALRSRFPDKKIVGVFQPHQMRRVIVGWKDFVEALNLYDDVLIYDIYAARENLADFENLEQFRDLDGEITKKKIGDIFAQDCGGNYLENDDKILEKIGNYGKESVVIYYSAGDLDYLVRGGIFPN